MTHAFIILLLYRYRAYIYIQKIEILYMLICIKYINFLH